MPTGLGQYGFGVKTARYAAAGKYYTAVNPTAGTGIISGVVTSLADTTPYLVVKNNNAAPATGTAGTRIHLDQLVLDVTVVGTTFSGSRKWAHKIDYNTSRANPTGGSTITPQPSGRGADGTIGTSNAQVFAGALTAAAAGDARLIESGTLCSAIEVVFSTFTFGFGDPLAQPITGLVDNSTTPMHKYFPLAPVVLAPGEMWTFHIWGASLSVGITFAFKLGYIEV
jgi:hypothetical protein